MPRFQERSPRIAELVPTLALSPIAWTRLSRLLEGYIDRDFIVQGCRLGFSLGYRGASSSTFKRNSLSVHSNPHEALKKINAEIKLNRIAGPFDVKPFQVFKCSPLSLRHLWHPLTYFSVTLYILGKKNLALILF